MSEPCWRCGARASCKHRQVPEPPTVSLPESRKHERGLHKSQGGAKFNWSGPARDRIQDALEKWKKLTR